MKYLLPPAALFFPHVSPGGDLVPFMSRCWTRLRVQEGVGGGGEGDGVDVSLCLLTSLISFIFAPPFPMREPHWLAGITSRRVTGGLELMVPLATNAARSCKGRDGQKKERGRGLKREKTGSLGGREQTARTKGGPAEGKARRARAALSSCGSRSLTAIFEGIVRKT